MSQTLDPAFPVRREPSETIKPAYQSVEVTEEVASETPEDSSEATEDSEQAKAT